MFKNTYLVRLYRQNKYLFCFVMLFIFFQQYFYSKCNATFPWFIWAMYSHKEYIPEKVSQYEFYANEKRINLTGIPIWQDAVITHTFGKYYELKQHDFQDPIQEIVIKRTSGFPDFAKEFISGKIINQPAESKEYPEWLAKYISNQVINEKLHELKVKQKTYYYNGKNFIASDSGQTLLKLSY